MKRTQDIHEALPLYSKAFSMKAEAKLILILLTSSHNLNGSK
ncbi:hypothetical protein AB1278_11760 [Chryseobacterium sp. NRRL B-14798]